MKRFFLSFLVLSLSTLLIGQNSNHKSKTIHLPQSVYNIPPPAGVETVLDENEQLERQNSAEIEVSSQFLKIATSENGYSIFGPQRTYLWADPNLNSIIFTIVEKGKITYTVSSNGGSEWSSPTSVYPSDSLVDPAPQYTQGGIINTPGNTNPDEAWFTFLSPTHDGSNGSLGGYAYGINKLTDTLVPDPSQGNLTSEGDIQRTIPEAFTITQQGISWYADLSHTYVNDEWKYNGKLIVGRGEMNESNQLEYTETSIDFLDSTFSFNDSKIAFSPDGQTGYFMALAYSSENSTPYSLYHPVMIKTTDGGATWGNPVHIQLGGVDGVEKVKEYFTDEAIENAGYPTDFNRDEVFYMMGFHFDLITDYFGNPYLTGIIAIADEEGWFPYEYQMATWNLFSKDGGETWNAKALYDNIWFQGEVGNLTMYNRPYISSSYMGECLYFSWLDSDIDAASENNRPNIYIVGYSIEYDSYTNAEIVTYFTQAWNRAYFGSQSYWIFTDEEMYGCEIPFVFAEFTDPEDETQPVNYWYIDNFVPFNGCCSVWIGIDENDNAVKPFTVSQNFPNPASDKTEILVSGKTNSPIRLIVSDLLGKVIFTEERKSNAEVHSFMLDVSGFEPGIYFYSVASGNQTVTKKFVVQQLVYQFPFWEGPGVGFELKK